MANSFGKNDLNIFNEIICQIHEIEELDTMRRNFLSSVRLLIPWRSGNFYLADRQGRHLLSDPVSIDFPIEALKEYLEKYEAEDPTRWIFINAKSIVYRETELFSAEAIARNPCFQEFYYPHNLYHSLQISLARHGRFLGSLSFYRHQDDPDFTDNDLFFFNLFKEHLSIRLYREWKRDESGPAEIDIQKVNRRFNLTSRESEILNALLSGLAVPEIAHRLCISPNTVKKHTTNLYKKIGISNRWELNTTLAEI